MIYILLFSFIFALIIISLYLQYKEHKKYLKDLEDNLNKISSLSYQIGYNYAKEELKEKK